MSMKCDIKFERNAVYFSGQTLNGICELTLEKPKSLRALVILIEGFSQSSWFERHHDNRRRRRKVEFKGREDYLSFKTYLLGGPDDNQIEIPAGFHTYNFTCVLPPHLPTSFEGKYGHIRYTATLTIDRPWKFDINHKVGFTVLKQLDLNHEIPDLRIPNKMEIIKKFGCWIWEAPLILSASIPASGYVSGQSIKVSVEVNNQTNILIDSIRVSLKKLLQYHVLTPRMKTREEIINMAEVRSLGVMKNEAGSFEIELPIPSVPPSNKSFSKIINVSYVVQIKAHATGSNKSPFVRIPVTIGTIPLTTTIAATNNNGKAAEAALQQRTTEMPSSSSQVNVTISSPPEDLMTNNEANLVDLRDLPPPSYEEIFRSDGGVPVNHGDQHNMGIQFFNPRYPLYDFGNSAAVATAQNLADTSEDAPSYGWAQNQQDAPEDP